MIKDVNINSFQFFVLVFAFTIGNTIINAPSLIVSQAKQDAWISSILGLTFGVCLVLLYCKLAGKFPNKTIVEFTELLLGKTLGKIISFLLLSYFFILASLMLRQLGTFVVTFILPETPRLAVNILFVFILLMGVYLGVETMARSAEIFFPILILFLLFIIIFLTPEADLENLKPIYENGFKPIARGTLNFISIPYLQLIVFLMIMPFVSDKNKAIKPFLLGVIIGGLFLTSVILHSILVLGVPIAEHKQYTTYFLAQKISIADIIERLEVIVAFLWFLTIFYKTSIFLYATKIGLSQILNLKETRIFIFPLGFLLLIVTHFITPNVLYFEIFFKEIIPFYTLTFGLLLPVLLIFVAFLKKESNIKKENSY